MTLDYKKVLLVHPLGYQSDSASRDISRLANIMPPIGLTGIAAFLEERSIVCRVIDYFAKPNSDIVIKDYLLREKPGFMGISSTTSSFIDGIRIATFAKNLLPTLKIVFGGPHVSALKEKVMVDYPVIDFCIVGEGESVLFELIKREGEKLTNLKGVVYRAKDGQARFTGHQHELLDLDSLPFPAYEKLDGYPNAYKLPIFNYPKSPNTSCISSRGCPYSCSYCDRSIFGRTFRYNSAEYLFEHLRYLKERFGIKHINFYDDQFTFNRSRVESFTKMMIDEPLQMTFNCAVRAEHIDSEILKSMKAAGCWMISLGIETGDENLLAQHRQNANLRLIREKIHLIKEAGIRTKGLLMMGLPGETESSIQKSMDYTFSLPIDDFNLAKFTPFPGSPIYENIHQMGEFNENWEKMDCMHFLFIPNGMSKDKLERYFQLFYKSHFMRLRVIWGYITMLWRSPDSWLRFLKNLKDFVVFARSNKRIGEN